MKKNAIMCATALLTSVACAAPDVATDVTAATMLKHVPTTTVLSNLVNLGAGSPTNRLLWTSVTNEVSAKRDRADMAVYELEREHWTWADALTPDAPPDYTNCPPDLIEHLNSYGAKKPYLEHPSDTTWIWVIGSVETSAGKYDQSALDSFPPDATNVVFTFNRKGDLNRFFRARAVRPSINDNPVIASQGVRLATTADTPDAVVSNEYGSASAALKAVGGERPTAFLDLSATEGTNTVRMIVAPGGFALEGTVDGESMSESYYLPDEGGQLALKSDIKPSGGEARILPKYAHYAEFDDTYDDDAQAFYSRYDNANFAFSAGKNGRGGCTAARIAQGVVRHYDWNLDEGVEFVGRTPAKEGRHGSVYVSQIPIDTTGIDEAFVSSGQWSPFYRIIPGRAVDGINDAGLVVEVNVIPSSDSDPQKGVGGRDLSGMGVVRYVLDHFEDAATAAKTVADRYYVPAAYRAKHMAFHWMISTKDETWIVEDGHALRIDDGVALVKMTNFRILGSSGFDPAQNVLFNESALATYDPYGNGIERFKALSEQGSFDSLDALAYFMRGEIAWTRTYTDDHNYRASEYATPEDEEGTPRSFMDTWCMDRAKAVVLSVWPGKSKEQHRAEGFWWQTCHASVYDYDRKTLRVCFQEDFDNRYEFACPATGGIDEGAVRAIVDEKVDPLAESVMQQLAVKRNVMDLAVYATTTTVTYEAGKVVDPVEVDGEALLAFVAEKGLHPYRSGGLWHFDAFTFDGIELTAVDVWASDMDDNPESVTASVSGMDGKVTAQIVFVRTVTESAPEPVPGESLAKSSVVDAKRGKRDLNVYDDVEEKRAGTIVGDVTSWGLDPATDTQIREWLAEPGHFPRNIDLATLDYEIDSPAGAFGKTLYASNRSVEPDGSTVSVGYMSVDYTAGLQCTWNVVTATNADVVVDRLATEGAMSAVARAEAEHAISAALQTNDTVRLKRGVMDLAVYERIYNADFSREFTGGNQVDGAAFDALLEAEDLTVAYQEGSGTWSVVRQEEPTVPVESVTFDGDDFVYDTFAAVVDGQTEVTVSFHTPSWLRTANVRFYHEISNTVPTDDRLAKLSEIGQGGGVDTNAVKDIIGTFEYPYDAGTEYGGISHFTADISGLTHRPFAVVRADPDYWTGSAEVGDSATAFFTLRLDRSSPSHPTVTVDNAGIEGFEGMGIQVISHFEEAWTNGTSHTYTNGFVLIAGGEEMVIPVTLTANYDRYTRYSETVAVQSRVEDVANSVYTRREKTDLYLYYEIDTWDPFKMSGDAPDYAQAAFDAAGRPQPEWNGEWMFTATLTADGHTLTPQSVTEGRSDEGAEEIKVMFIDSPSGDKPEIGFFRTFHKQGSRITGEDRLAKLSDVGQGGGGVDGQAVTNIVQNFRKSILSPEKHPFSRNVRAWAATSSALGSRALDLEWNGHEDGSCRWEASYSGLSFIVAPVTPDEERFSLEVVGVGPYPSLSAEFVGYSLVTNVAVYGTVTLTAKTTSPLVTEFDVEQYAEGHLVPMESYLALESRVEDVEREVGQIGDLRMKDDLAVYTTAFTGPYSIVDAGGLGIDWKATDQPVYDVDHYVWTLAYTDPVGGTKGQDVFTSAAVAESAPNVTITNATYSLQLLRKAEYAENGDQLMTTNDFPRLAKDRLSLEMNQSIGLVSKKSLTILGGVVSAALDPDSNLRHVSLMPTGGNGQIKSTVAGGSGYVYDLPAKSGTLALVSDVQTASEFRGLKLTALAPNSTVSMMAQPDEGTPSISLRYSTDDGTTWSPFVVGTTVVTLAHVGDSVCFESTQTGINKTAGPGGENADDSNVFVMTGLISASGNINSILSKAGEWESITSLKGADWTFNALFFGCSSLVAPPDLPAVEVSDGSYHRMFMDCTSLVRAPDLPASNAYYYAYKEMFWGCTALSVPPVISATDFYTRSCYGMFKNCFSLGTAPALPCTSLGQECYRDMFVRCRALTVAPALPSAGTPNHCYQDMFWECTGLRVAPCIRLGLNVGDESLSGTFHGCIGLVEGPVIVIDEGVGIGESSFAGMFGGCSSLRSITLDYSGAIDSDKFSGWVEGVSAKGTLYYQGSTTTQGTSGVPTGWTVVK